MQKRKRNPEEQQTEAEEEEEEEVVGVAWPAPAPLTGEVRQGQAEGLTLRIGKSSTGFLGVYKNPLAYVWSTL